ncbi:hypothetical protein LTR85_010806 [Meristemomyces frigidus]|nr:hypothetical protein LTR85_010806 [Meristemomyces frigidus]
MSGGGNNATISFPGPEWVMRWPYGFDNFQLDIVGFLAILGEGSVAANAQVAALSRLFYLPRLIPAPQALLWPNRPVTLDPTKATVMAVYSGNSKDHVHHVAHVLLGDEMPTFMVRCVEVRKKTERRTATRMDTFFRGQPVRAKTQSPMFDPPSVKAKATGPLAWVTLLGFSLSVSLFTLSIAFGDGMSLLATILLSLLSTLVGMGNKWSLKLPRRPQDSKPPAGDVVIRYPNGSYLVVKCDEDVARELYFAPEEIDYNIKSPAYYRLISLVGTLMLMLGVICLANARLQLQFAWAGAYILINIAQWTAAALPARLHWDLSCYDVKEQSVVGGPKCPTFTEALWKAIMLTKSTRWVKDGKAAPRTEVWDAWLVEALEKAQAVQKSKTDILLDPQWPKKKGARGIVWEDPDEWQPKEAWNQLNEEFSEAARNNAMHPTTAA